MVPRSAGETFAAAEALRAELEGLNNLEGQLLYDALIA